MKKFLLLIMIALLTAAVAAQEKTPPAVDDAAAVQPVDGGEITVSADHVQMQIGEIAKLEGNVLVEDNAMVFTSDQMTIFFAQKDGAAAETDEAHKSVAIEKIEAAGKVMVRTPDGRRSATGDRGFYDAKTEIITLDGNCTILTDGNVMHSKQVVYDRRNQSVSAARATLTIPVRSGGNKRGDSLGGIFGGLETKDKPNTNQPPAATPAGDVKP